MTTYRTNENGRLFPSIEWDSGWELSIQADKDGYQCSPKQRLDRLEDYETVEVKVDGPFAQSVDVTTMEVPFEVMSKFQSIENGMPALGFNLTWSDVDALKAAIVKAAQNPNVGIPPGRIGWPGRSVYHGTTAEHADDIVENGIDFRRSEGGFFGIGFYTAENRELAERNYASFVDEGETPAVLELEIAEGAKILDLRNAKDWEAWLATGLNRKLDDPDLPFKARRAGVDGLFDASFGGVVIFNEKAVCEYIRRLDIGPHGPKI